MRKKRESLSLFCQKNRIMYKFFLCETKEINIDDFPVWYRIETEAYEGQDEKEWMQENPFL